MVIKKIDVASAAKVSGVLYAALGFIFGALLAVLALIGAGLSDSAATGEAAWLAPLFGVGAIVFLPIMYGVIGLIGGALTAWVYNVVAGVAGGLRVEVE